MDERTTTPRPRKPRGERLEARLSRDQKALLRRAAALQGQTLSDFVVASAEAAAVRAIADQQAISLDARESRAFADTLLAPRPPADKLKAAALRYLDMLG